MSNVFSVHQRTCLIYHTPAYVGAIRRSVKGPLANSVDPKEKPNKTSTVIIIPKTILFFSDTSPHTPTKKKKRKKKSNILSSQMSRHLNNNVHYFRSFFPESINEQIRASVQKNSRGSSRFQRSQSIFTAASKLEEHYLASFHFFCFHVDLMSPKLFDCDQKFVLNYTK